MKFKKRLKKLEKLWRYYFNTFPFMKKEFEHALDIGEDLTCGIEPSKEKIKKIIKELKSAKF